MLKDELFKQFSYRLREAMIASGFHSVRTPSGVDLQKLKEMTGYSLQICRKYLRGEALPEITKIIEIAKHLQVSPGWLLFGEEYCQRSTSIANITISKSLLHYLYIEFCRLYFSGHEQANMPDFLMSITKDISEITTSTEQSKRIIDLALSSAKHFQTHQKAS